MSDTIELNLAEGSSLTKTLLMAHLNDAINRIFPLFLENMPVDYFKAVNESDQIAHLERACNF